MDIQDKVNELAKLLRVQIIEALIKEDCIKYGAEIPEDWKLNFMVESIDKLKCCTRKLRTLFKDAHQYHENIGMFPHAAPLPIWNIAWISVLSASAANTEFRFRGCRTRKMKTFAGCRHSAS